ncbi:MAG: DUF2752 domain-containing protein [Verrucomicrobiaceae bacterium]|nr:MAG: DUF2752 domain-containing protein [Verrucomicrobiaceae bacterium]
MSAGDMAAGRAKPAWAARVALGVLLVTVLWVMLVRYEPVIRGLSPGCFFKRFTGLDCAGCGGTRAFFAFLKGDIALSLRMNPLFLAGLAVGGFLGVMKLWDRRPGGRPGWLAWARVTTTVGWCSLGIILVFWIVRNFPWWPFTLLAPP